MSFHAFFLLNLSAMNCKVITMEAGCKHIQKVHNVPDVCDFVLMASPPRAEGIVRCRAEYSTKLDGGLLFYIGLQLYPAHCIMLLFIRPEPPS